MSSPQAFARLIEECSYKDKPFEDLTPLTNITFFLGAGFSKSWDTRYPTGLELFSFRVGKYSDVLFEFVDNLGYNSLAPLNFSKFKDMAYELSMQKKYSSIRSRYLDIYNLKMVEDEISVVITKRFKDLLPINYIKDFSEKLSASKPLELQQVEILNFFAWINDQSTGDADGIPEGVRAHFITTNYDFLIETILDEILPPDDSHLLYTYRGFTPFNINKGSNPSVVFKHWLVQNVIKINGGFEIYRDGNGFRVDYTLKSDIELKANPPLLIVPNREQDYTGDYFQVVFPKAIRALQESKILVIVGYSLPEEDALLRILIRQFAEENVDGAEKTIFYIDSMPDVDQQKKLQSVFPYHSRANYRYNIFTYSGSFSKWVEQVNHARRKAIGRSV